MQRNGAVRGPGAMRKADVCPWGQVLGFDPGDQDPNVSGSNPSGYNTAFFPRTPGGCATYVLMRIALPLKTVQ